MNDVERDSRPTLRTMLVAAAVSAMLLLACKSESPDRTNGVGGVAGSAGASGSSLGGAGASGGVASAGASGASAAGAGAGGSVASAGASGGGPPTFTRVYNDVLKAKSCTGPFCHGDSMQAMMPMRTQEEAYASLVSVPAAGPRCGTSGKIRVVPGDPAASLLLDKISNMMPACGDTMPTGVSFAPNCIVDSKPTCTTQDEIMLVRDWIAAGARND